MTKYIDLVNIKESLEVVSKRIQNIFKNFSIGLDIENKNALGWSR